MFKRMLSTMFSAIFLLGAEHTLCADSCIREINSIEEHDRVQRMHGPKVIVYNSSTCGACKPMEESLERAGKSCRKVRFYKLDLTKEDGQKKRVFEGLGKRLDIKAYPTTHFIEPQKKPRIERGSMGFDEVDEIVHEMENGKKKPMKK